MVIASTGYEIIENYLCKYKKWDENIQNEEKRVCEIINNEIENLDRCACAIPNIFERKVVLDISMLFKYMIKHLDEDFSIYFLNELVRLRIEDTNRILQDKNMGEKVKSRNMDDRVRNIYIKYCSSEHGNHCFSECERILEDRRQAFTEFRISNIFKDLKCCLLNLENKIENLRLSDNLKNS